MEQQNYLLVLGSLKEKIRQAQQRAVLSVNTELLGIYWEIGRTIANQEAVAGWGAKVVDRLANDLRLEFPDQRGFSSRNLRYMREFYLAYRFPILQPPVAKLGEGHPEEDQNHQVNENQDFIILQPLVAKLPWSHHTVILTKAKNAQERTFYIQKCVENGWSKSVLEAQIDTGLHNRLGQGLNNFAKTLPELQSELAAATFKSPYVFDFLRQGEKMQERDLEGALVQHLKKFLLELGKGFAFVGNQYRLKVEGDEFILDLLFYHVALHSYVIFEIKLCDFVPEFAGKLNFYINVVDEQLKGLDDNPTIGVLLCKTPNSTVVRYALNGINSPMGISQYELTEALPQALKGEMPSIEDLEAEMDKEYAELHRPVANKLDKVKAMMRSLKQKEQESTRNPLTVRQVFDQVLLPLKSDAGLVLKDIAEEFRTSAIHLWVGDAGFESDLEANAQLEKTPEPDALKLEVILQGCSAAGSNAFDSRKVLKISMEPQMIRVGVDGNGLTQDYKEYKYDALPNITQRSAIIEGFADAILDEIFQKLEEVKDG